MADFRTPLAEVTIVIEWENPRDVGSVWTDRAMRSLAEELAREGAVASDKPTVLYLFDTEVLDEASVRRSIARSAPELDELASLRVIPTPGLTYYQLKNHGVALTETPYVILLDSDVSPQPGWLRGLLRPFEDPQIMAVSGVTSLESHDLISRTMALIWIFDLPSEHENSRGEPNVHANNSAFRTRFFQENPFPNTLAFKKQCGPGWRIFSNAASASNALPRRIADMRHTQGFGSSSGAASKAASTAISKPLSRTRDVSHESPQQRGYGSRRPGARRDGSS